MCVYGANSLEQTQGQHLGFATNKIQQINQLACSPSFPLSLSPLPFLPHYFCTLLKHMKSKWQKHSKETVIYSGLLFPGFMHTTPWADSLSAILPLQQKAHLHSPDLWRQTALVTAQWSNAWLPLCHLLGQELCPARYKCKEWQWQTVLFSCSWGMCCIKGPCIRLHPAQRVAQGIWKWAAKARAPTCYLTDPFSPLIISLFKNQ